MFRLNEFYKFTGSEVKYQLVEIGMHHVYIKDIISGKTYPITKESFELNYKRA